MSRFCLTVHRWGRIVSLHWKDLHRPRRQTTTCKRDGGIAVSIVHPPLGDVSWTSQLAFFPARRGGSMACSHCSSGSACRPQGHELSDSAASSLHLRSSSAAASFLCCLGGISPPSSYCLGRPPGATR